MRPFCPILMRAYSLARWLVHDSADAQDMVQEAYLYAWKVFPGFHGGDGCPWILTIARNAWYTWLRNLGCSRRRVR